ncbi:MAG: FMN-binding negative transcriptional regulator [Bernardetiaceae bacterium]|nr:FMN-binding negative transcriptional regulator [Bernardetiaceae bacterium]
MYIPQPYKLEERSKIIEFIKTYPFATLLSHENKIHATHLPVMFVASQTEGDYLLSHWATANPQSQIKSEVLCIFQSPHAYISPAYYTRPSVPTWNYIAVHVYGTLEPLNSDKEKTEVLIKTIKHFEPNYIQDFHNLSETYKNQLLPHLSAFKIQITNWEAVAKLSQDRNIEEQKNIIEGLAQSQNQEAQSIATFMTKWNT